MLKLHTTVGICIPSGPQWEADFGMCLINLFAHVLTRPMKGVRQIHIKLFNERSSLLPKSRQGLLEKAIAGGCDFALFIDTDQTFPSNLLYRLLHWKMPVVACNVPTKSIPSCWTARTFNPNFPGGDVIFSDLDKHGIEKVWRVGTGIMLVDLDVVKKMPKPWFGIRYMHNGKYEEFVGEDWYFCEELDKIGAGIYIDHDLSREIGHVGKLTYTHELIGEVVREAVEANKAATAEPLEAAAK